MPSRLTSGHPAIQNALDAISQDNKTKVTTRVVLWIASETGLNSPTIQDALLKGDWNSLNDLCSEMDEQYLELLDRGDNQHQSFFCKARAYSAAACLARGDLDEAIYESIFATQKALVIDDFL
jgi:predicted alpha/beta superfamily hydrolase